MLISEEGQAKLKELRNSGDFARIDISSDYGFSWSVQLAWSELSKRRPDGSRSYQLVRPPDAESPSLDVAIDAAYEYWKANRREPENQT